DYAADCNEQGKQRDNGPPWPRISMALVAHFLATLAGNREPAVSQALAVLKHYWTQTIKDDKSVALSLLPEHVRYCRIRACLFDEKAGKKEADTYKRQFMMGPYIQVVTIDGMSLVTAHAALQVCIRQENGKIKPGAATEVALERDAERLLAKFGM
ncbi:unnamed protein product, partial [Prorocentrum cordatum]